MRPGLAKSDESRPLLAVTFDGAVLALFQSRDRMVVAQQRAALTFLPRPFRAFHDFQKRLRRVAQHAPCREDQPDLALDVELLHLHFFQQALLQVLLDAHLGHERYALVARHHHADGLDGGHFDIHIEGHLRLLESLEDHVAIR